MYREYGFEHDLNGYSAMRNFFQFDPCSISVDICVQEALDV